MSTSTAASTPVAAATAPRRIPSSLAAVAGIVAAASALAVGELFAAFVTGAPSPVAAVGAALIDFAPPGSKDIIVGLFGTNDKPALLVLVAVVVLAVGAALGLVARTRPAVAMAGIVVLVGVGFLASLRLAEAQLALVLLSAALQAIVGIQVLSVLLAAAPAVDAAGGVAPGTGAAGTRRGFLLRAGGLGALAVMGGALGRSMVEGRATQVATAGAEIPQPVDAAPAPAPDSSFDIAGLTPLVVPNSSFYRIDTALVTPSVDVNGWTLRVHGMVRNEVTLTFAQLVELPLHEQYVTIACVSNEVGGQLVGNAKWTGVRLTDVLDMAGVLPGATQIVPRSIDDWAAGFPTEWVTAPERPRDALIAVKMNDEPLPAAHGFPARLIVPGLYGYVSATKWLSEIELTTLEAFDAYWVPRGWAKEAPILTQSRIDVPARNARVAAGPVAVAGVAWAPDRGISRVEVQVDDGEWQPATVATPIGPQTWVQWKLAWQATAGDHRLSVRATDGLGEVQTDMVTRPDPDGARGYHQIAVSVA
ncbi:MAG TPA: molybdopterin-dependent oxidoreductase [Candidatus Limnocylindrales bacterium]|nr:molybdopterin-dependent oxidoreductase [Candidatus Limnocylindrales bacterium]